MYSPFAKITSVLTFPPLWSSFSELSEMLSPGLQSSVCPKQNLTCNSHVVLVFFFLSQHNVVLVSGVQQSDSVIRPQAPILFQILFPLRLLLNTEQSSLSCTVGPGWLSALYIAVRTCQSPAPSLSLPLPHRPTLNFNPASQFSQNPPSPISDHCPSAQFPAPAPQVTRERPACLQEEPCRLFQLEQPTHTHTHTYPWCFLLVNFHPPMSPPCAPWPQTPTFPGHVSVEFNLSHCKTPLQ